MADSWTITLLIFLIVLTCLFVWENKVLTVDIELKSVKAFDERLPQRTESTNGISIEILSTRENGAAYHQRKLRTYLSHLHRVPTSVPTGVPTSSFNDSCIVPKEECNPDHVACPLYIALVCGCNNQTYNNACEARYFHCVRTWTVGKCNNGTSC